MNGEYYQNPTFPTNEGDNNILEKIEDNYNNDIALNELLKNNIKKRVNIYFNNSKYEGILRVIGNDYLVISNPQNNYNNLFIIEKIDYIEFLESINN